MEENKCLYELMKQKILEHRDNEGKISRKEVKRCLSQYRVPKELWFKVIEELEKIGILMSDGKFKFKVVIND